MKYQLRKRKLKIVKFKTDLVFEIGEVLVFRGTDGLPFNLLKITENVSRGSIGPRSKLGGDFLAETSQDEENIFYAIDRCFNGIRTYPAGQR